MKLNWQKLYKALDDQRSGESWRSLALRYEVTPSLFTRISQGKPTSVRNLLKLAEILKPTSILNFAEEPAKKVKKS